MAPAWSRLRHDVTTAASQQHQAAPAAAAAAATEAAIKPPSAPNIAAVVPPAAATLKRRRHRREPRRQRRRTAEEEEEEDEGDIDTGACWSAAVRDSMLEPRWRPVQVQQNCLTFSVCHVSYSLGEEQVAPAHLSATLDRGGGAGGGRVVRGGVGEDWEKKSTTS